MRFHSWNGDVIQGVLALRKAGYRVGIVTDSFCIAAEIVRRRVFADFSIAHLMHFQRGEATGQITLSPAMTHPQGCPQHSLCKLNVMQHVLDQMGLHPADVQSTADIRRCCDDVSRQYGIDIFVTCTLF
jgi:hypothetical protein